MADAGILPTSRELRGPGGSALALSSLGSPKKQRGPAKEGLQQVSQHISSPLSSSLCEIGEPVPP